MGTLEKGSRPVPRDGRRGTAGLSAGVGADGALWPTGQFTRNPYSCRSRRCLPGITPCGDWASPAQLGQGLRLPWAVGQETPCVSGFPAEHSCGQHRQGPRGGGVGAAWEEGWEEGGSRRKAAGEER